MSPITIPIGMDRQKNTMGSNPASLNNAANPMIRITAIVVAM